MSTLQLSKQDTDDETQIARARREEVVEHGLLHAHAGVEEDGEVAQLVGQLLTEHSEGHGDA